MDEFFRELASEHPRWNFIWIYDDRQQDKILSGLWMTVKLSVACVILSVIIGVIGAWMQDSRSRVARGAVQAYIQFFRNTPPFVQLLFFYFALGAFVPSVVGEDGWTRTPLISNVGWAIISLSFFAGAFNVEIFRAGVEAVPQSTREAAQSLGLTRWQTYRHIVLPLAFRVSLPALNNNLINLVKTTTQALAIAVPELLYQARTIWSDFPSAQYPTMILVWVIYILLVGILAMGMKRWERAMRIPGYGQ